MGWNSLNKNIHFKLQPGWRLSGGVEAVVGVHCPAIHEGFRSR